MSRHRRTTVRRVIGTSRRQIAIRVVLVVVVAVLAAGAVAVSPLSRVFEGRSTTIDHACVPASPTDPIGVAVGTSLLTLSDADLGRALDLTVAAGMRWIRFDVAWSSIEATRGTFDWSVTDRVVNAAHARGLSILGIVDTTPEWARLPGATDDDFSLPADIAAFGDFAGRAAQRYRDTISSWEVWNEPNITAFAAPRPSVQRYAAMLSAASRAIRSSGPRDVRIVTAGLSPAVDQDGNIAPTTFLDELYRVGDKRDWDAVGTHPYSYPFLPLDKGSRRFNAFAQLSRLYATMQRNGDGDKQLWITEYGAPTGGSPEQRVSQRFQADSLWSAIMYARRAMHFGPFFVYSLRDAGTDGGDVEDNFGILRVDFSPKLAYATIRQAAACR
ncbi:MAG: beta-xylosidase [Gordonia paraffinivorans]